MPFAGSTSADEVSTVRERVAAWLYLLGWAVVCRMPRRWAEWMFRQIADQLWRRQGRASGSRWRGADRVPAPGGGRGVIFALPHMGNWEQAGAWIVLRGAGKITTVAERLRPASLYDRFVTLRESLGVEVLPHSGGAGGFGVLAQRLRVGGLVCLLCERDLTGSGIEVEFFGEPARIMGGPAALAEQTGAALMPVTLWYEGQNWGAHIHQEIPVPKTGAGQEKIAAMTQQLARVLEAVPHR